MSALKYLSNDLLEKALINALEDKSVKVLSIQTSLAVANGDNYMSDVFRVLIYYQTADMFLKKAFLIVKYMLETEKVAGLIKDYKMFTKEKEIYVNFLPKASKVMHEEFAPKCHYIYEDQAQMFVMEDLKNSGYTLVDRQSRLNLEHCLLVVKKLARMHAASMILAEQEPELMEKFDFAMINKYTTSGNVLPTIMMDGLRTLIEVAADWHDYRHIVKKLVQIQDNFEERAVKCINQESSFKVLNHGDLWTNNFMIKYDKKAPVDVLFIDFQLGFYSSMGIDWNFFMTLSPNNFVKAHHRELLLETYYSALVVALTNQNYDNSKIPTLKNVQDEVDNYEFYGFCTAVGVLPVVLMDRNSGVVSNIEAFEDEKAGEVVRKVQFGGKVFQKAIKQDLKRFDGIGILD